MSAALSLATDLRPRPRWRRRARTVRIEPIRNIDRDTKLALSMLSNRVLIYIALEVTARVDDDVHPVAARCAREAALLVTLKRGLR